MEVVSTSKLDSSETEKTTTACNFNLIMPWEAYMNMNQKICKSEVIHTFMIVEM